MKFGNPDFFHLFWSVPLLIIFLMWGLQKKRHLTEIFYQPTSSIETLHAQYRRRQTAKAFFSITAVFFIIMALTQPRWGFEWKELTQEGVDIIVALDVSTSMLAEDIKPNRLSRAKRKISDLLDMLEGDRIGLVAFAGTAFIQCPLTLDYTALKLFLDATDTDLISAKGTALAEAMRKSISAFKSGDDRSRTIILITDGENHEGDPLKVANSAARQGIKIFTIGIGAEGGAPIPDTSGDFKKDAGGEIILTRLGETMLQKIALDTGGTYVRSVTGDLDLNKIYLENIKPKLEKKELKIQRRKLWTERFQWSIFLALACLVIEFLIQEKQIRNFAEKR